MFSPLAGIALAVVLALAVRGLLWILAFPVNASDLEPTPGGPAQLWRRLLDRVQLTRACAALRSTSAVRQQAADRLGVWGRVLTWVALALGIAVPVLCVAFVLLVAW